MRASRKGCVIHELLGRELGELRVEAPCCLRVPTPREAVAQRRIPRLDVRPPRAFLEISSVTAAGPVVGAGRDPPELLLVVLQHEGGRRWQQHVWVIIDRGWRQWGPRNDSQIHNSIGIQVLHAKVSSYDLETIESAMAFQV